MPTDTDKNTAGPRMTLRQPPPLPLVSPQPLEASDGPDAVTYEIDKGLAQQDCLVLMKVHHPKISADDMSSDQTKQTAESQ